MPHSAHTVELLAPAGNIECLHAAVAAGANAVYLGLGEFNARRNADNFTIESLKDACEYAHLRGVRVYVTMNVEILPRELPRAMQVIADAYRAGADAFIIQDIGLAAEVARCYPHIAIHLSTQMNIHNAAGIEFAARLGASRVTLARELSLAEIAELAGIAALYSMEVECFVHGALCVCYSGQCLMSSLIGGRSANRGLCAQACRLAYDLHRDDRETPLPAEGDHLLSPRDLCGAELVRDLVQAGVASLKIEGRMKSADYVHEVAATYREIIDAETAPSEQQKARLSEAFSRGFTTAYMEGERGNALMSYGRPNNRGVFAGRVVRAVDGTAEVKAETSLNAGDLVEFWTNKGHFTAEVPTDTPAGGVARIPIQKRSGKGDRVFRVRNAQTAFEDDAFAPRIPLTGRIVLHRDEPAYLSFCTADGIEASAYGVQVEQARTKELNAADVRAHIDRLGQTPFYIDDEADGLDIELDPGVGISFSKLHHLRSEVLQELQRQMLQPFEHEVPGPYEPRETMAAPASSEPLVCAWTTNPGCARAAKRAGADNMYVPLLNFRRGQSVVAGVRAETAEQAGYPKQCIMALPTIDHDPVPGTREYTLSFDPWDYVREGKPVFADNMADAWRALQMGALVEVGPHIPVTNAATLQFLAELGIKRVWLSPELTLGQIAELAEHSPVALGITVAGRQELMITEHCLLMSQGPCAEECETCPRRSTGHHLTDRKGFEFPVITDALGRSHLYNGIELDAVPNLPDFIDMGLSAFMVDTTFMDKELTGTAVRRLVRARDLALREHRALDKRPGTTTGHLFRGVQ